MVFLLDNAMIGLILSCIGMFFGGYGFNIANRGPKEMRVYCLAIAAVGQMLSVFAMMFALVALFS